MSSVASRRRSASIRGSRSAALSASDSVKSSRRAVTARSASARPSAVSSGPPSPPSRPRCRSSSMTAAIRSGGTPSWSASSRARASSVLADPDQRPCRAGREVDPGAGRAARGIAARTSGETAHVSARSISASESGDRGAARLSSRPRLVAAVSRRGRSGSSQLSANPSSATPAAARKTGLSAWT